MEQLELIPIMALRISLHFQDNCVFLTEFINSYKC